MTEKTEIEKRRVGIEDERIGSKSELQKITSQISAKMDESRHYKIKLNPLDSIDVTFGARYLYLSVTKIGLELTPRKAEILAQVLLEAVKRVGSSG